MTTLYLAGPMRGIEHYNFEAFLAGASELRDAGYEVICPAERDIANGFDPIKQGLTGNEDLSGLGFDLRTVLAWDLEQVCTKADGVALLKGWHRSKGASAEVATAAALGLPYQFVEAWVDQAGGRVQRPG